MACVAIGCKNRMGVKTDDNKKKISFHRFPKECKLRTKWIQNMNRKNWTPSPYSRLCSLHFDDSCYREDYQNTTLHSNAVPTKFTNARTHLLKKEKFKHPYILQKEKFNHHNFSRPELGLKKDFLEKIAELEDIISEQNERIKKLKKIAQHYKTTAKERGLNLKKIKQRYITQTKRIKYSESIINDLETKLRIDAAKIDILCTMIGKDN